MAEGAENEAVGFFSSFPQVLRVKHGSTMTVQ